MRIRTFEFRFKGGPDKSSDYNARVRPYPFFRAKSIRTINDYRPESFKR